MTEARIVLPGSEGYWDSYDKGGEIEALWPGQDGYELASGCAHNTWGPLANSELGLAGLLMLQQGGRDESEWVWVARLSDESHWWVVGWCDYTGWDCQSWLGWAPWDA